MAVIEKRYCYDDAVINYHYRESTVIDNYRRLVFNFIYENYGLKEISEKIWNYKRIGKDTKCLAEELQYLTALGELFIMIKQEVNCSNLDTFDDVLADYKLDCIECELKCRYGKGDLVNKLIDLLALRVPLIGISYMTIQGPNDVADCVPFEVIAPN